MANIAEHADYRTDDNSRVFISNKNALDNLGIYFHNHEEMSRDSFDFLIWMTRYNGFVKSFYEFIIAIYFFQFQIYIFRFSKYILYINAFYFDII